MPRYIDADAMIRKICGMKCGCERYECGYDEAGCPKVRDLETAPTVSPDEVRGVGEWIMLENQSKEDTDNGNYWYTCSHCSAGDLHAKVQEVPFCWKCGARMKGAETDG